MYFKFQYLRFFVNFSETFNHISQFVGINSTALLESEPGLMLRDKQVKVSPLILIHFHVIVFAHIVLVLAKLSLLQR